mmetsp:Transcript_11688/g.19441  ORF Transcript_11688/g.19441 Transcript_11688/m.19441 type:complete len:487 (+) Transcript_11688:473-1933(+)
MGLGVGRSTDAGQLNAGMVDELVLDRRGRHVLALGGLEDLLGPAGNLEATLLIDFSTVSGLHKAILRNGLLCGLLILVVAHHGAGTLDLNFTIVRDAHFHFGVGIADISGAGLSGEGQMRVVEILRHTISFKDFQANALVPLKQLRWNGGTAGTSQTDLVQTKALEDLFPDQIRNDGDLEKGVELLGFHLLKHPELELGPKTGDGHEEGGTGAVQVVDEGGQGLGEVDAMSDEEGGAFAQPTLHAVGEGKVGQVTVLGGGVEGGLVDADGGNVHGREVVHDALGTAGGARGVNDGGQLLGIALDGRLQGLGLGDDVGPLLVLAAVVVLPGTEGEGHGGHVGADPGLHLVPRVLVELADEEELRLRMLEDVLDRVAREGGVDRDGDVASEPDGQVGDDPPAAVLGAEGDAAALLEAEGAEVGRHPEGLVHGLLEGPVLDVGVAAAHGLGEEDSVGGLLRPGGEGVEEGLGFGHVGLFVVRGTADSVN